MFFYISRRNAPFGKKDVGEAVGSAYGITALVDTSQPDFIYDEVDQFNEEVARKDKRDASKLLHRIKSQKVWEMIIKYYSLFIY